MRVCTYPVLLRSWLGFGLAWPEPWPEAGNIWQYAHIMYIQGTWALGRTAINYPDPSQQQTPNSSHPLPKTALPNLLCPHHCPTCISTEAAVQCFVSVVQECVLPHLFLHCTQALAQCFSAVVNLVAPYQVFPWSLGLPAASQLYTHPYLLESLRWFMHHPNATFFNTAQVDATQLMYDQKEHFAYISATGHTIQSEYILDM